MATVLFFCYHASYLRLHTILVVAATALQRWVDCTLMHAKGAFLAFENPSISAIFVIHSFRVSLLSDVFSITGWTRRHQQSTRIAFFCCLHIEDRDGKQQVKIGGSYWQRKVATVVIHKWQLIFPTPFIPKIILPALFLGIPTHPFHTQLLASIKLWT